MKKLVIQKTDHTPEIILDHENKIFEITGESRPENVRVFYTQVFDWFNDYFSLVYFSSQNSELKLKLSFEYFNSTSAKVIYDLLVFLQQKSKSYNFNLHVIWCYNSHDKDMLESGEEISTISGLDFEFLSNETI